MPSLSSRRKPSGLPLRLVVGRLRVGSFSGLWKTARVGFVSEPSCVRLLLLSLLDFVAERMSGEYAFADHVRRDIIWPDLL